MSPLHCAARLFVARHGEAVYESDLSGNEGGTLTRRGREQAVALGERFARERIARVWTSPLSRAVQTAEIAASRLGCDVVVREDLREYVVATGRTHDDSAAHHAAVFAAWCAGDDEARTDAGELLTGLVARVGNVLDEIADAHEGESVLVVGHGGAILATVPQLVGLPRRVGQGVTLPNCGVLSVERDADGWRLTGWDGRDG